MGSESSICSTDLTLGLGFSSSSSYSYNHLTAKSELAKVTTSVLIFEPSLNLSLSCETPEDQNTVVFSNDKYSVDLCRQDSSVSSYQSNASAIREREVSIVKAAVEAAVAAERVVPAASCRVVMSDTEEYDDNNNVRKKHRLSKSQSALLEESFKQRSTLTPKQKQHLAKELNLRPRQVEVWFQNRRARTKLKQIEADYEVLKKCCETLREENRRLQKEVKALKQTKPSLYMAALNTCPSCETIGGGGGSAGGACKTTNKSSFTMAHNPHHFYNNPVTASPSAA